MFILNKLSSDLGLSTCLPVSPTIPCFHSEPGWKETPRALMKLFGPVAWCWNSSRWLNQRLSYRSRECFLAEHCSSLWTNCHGFLELDHITIFTLSNCKIVKVISFHTVSPLWLLSLAYHLSYGLYMPLS